MNFFYAITIINRNLISMKKYHMFYVVKLKV